MVKNFKDIHNNEDIVPTYGSRYMVESVPKYSLNDTSIPCRVAYQIIHDELVLDGKPSQNLASFCTTWMEPEARNLIGESLSFNLADEDEYPHVIQMEERCVNIIARMLNAPERGKAIGAGTIGSSEAVMLAGLAMKWSWRKKRQEKGLPCDKPNLIMGENVQVVWEKFARYFDVEPKFIPIQPGRYVITPEEIIDKVDENTIGVCAILGTTFTGEFEPIKEINDALENLKTDKGLDIPLHVDAASGGFVAPFLYPELEWDFRLSRVVSINVSGHKYGLVYPGIGWVIWRNKEALPEDLIFHVNYLGGDLPTFTLNFSRSASPVVAQYYNLLRLGNEGYTRIMQNLKQVSDYLDGELRSIELFEVVSNRESLPIAAWSIKEEAGFTAFELSDKLREYGWIVPAYTMPKNAENIAVLRAVVREHFSRDMADNFINDIQRAIKVLTKQHEDSVRHPEPKKVAKVC